MKISIITINKNNAEGLRSTIESVVNQSYNNIEYIIIDGNSEDNSVEVIKEFESKISYWISEPDSGIYNAMNKGIKNASGDYCQFLNSGDYLVDYNTTKTFIEKMPCNADIIYGNLLKTHKNKLFRSIGPADEKLTMLNFFLSTINHSPTYIKRKLFDTIGYYDESLKIVSDWKFFMEAIVFHQIEALYINHDVSVFDMSGISNTNEILRIKERESVINEKLIPGILSDYKSYGIYIKQVKRIKKYIIFRYMYWILERLAFKYEKYKLKKSYLKEIPKNF